MEQTERIKVLVVDDSFYMRYKIQSMLNQDPRIMIVGDAKDGLDALEKIPALRPDVVTLDIEMPRLNGLEALKEIMEKYPTPVIMLSSFTTRGAKETIQSLQSGAVDFVPKPNAQDMDTVKEILIEKILAASGANLRALKFQERPPISLPTAFPQAMEMHGIIVGCSTGGPKALSHIIPAIPPDFPAAIVIVQHMPAGFTRSLADRLNDRSLVRVKEGQDGDSLMPGCAIVAPGGYHLEIAEGRISLSKAPPVNSLRPAVDVTMKSFARAFGPRAIGVVLTGMGRDGTEGAVELKRRGGRIIAEQESTCIVYGMSKSVIENRLADHVVPLDQVADTLVKCLEQ